MEISYAEGTAINLQDAARDLDARLKSLESFESQPAPVDEALTSRVKLLEDEVTLLRAALEPKS
jgi:hypothetical protein